MLHWFTTLKFKIVALAVVTGVVSALATAQLVMSTTSDHMERLLLRNHADERESTAALLANKLDTLRITVTALARHMPPALWQDHLALQRYLEDKPAAHALFDTIFAADAQGRMLTRLVKGVPSSELRDIADRPYFHRALQTDQALVSDPILGPISRVPLIVIAVAAQTAERTPAGIVAGTTELLSARLFSDLGGTDHHDGSRTAVMDRAGRLLVHPDGARVLGSASEEPGLAEVFQRWHALGSPINTEGTAEFADGYVVSMAGIAASDWVLVRMTPQASATGPLEAARRTAWMTALAVGLAAALIAGAAAWYFTRPITRLRARAEQLLAHDAQPGLAWPGGTGELGDLARAFQQVVEQRQRKHEETEGLLQQLEAVLDHAEVGIALTRDGRFELVSRQFCAIFQCDKKQLLGQSARLIYPSDEAYAALSARALPAFMEHGAFDGEIDLVRLTGELFWAHMRGRAVVRGDRSKGTIWTIEDVTEVRAHRERLTWSSSHDAMTGLANRPAFEDLLEQATGTAATEPFCAMFVDLDRFKLVNDTGGHAAGDAMLRAVAQQIAAQVRRSDTVARLGGDEFAVLLSRCPLSQAREIAEKVRSAVGAYRLEWEGQRFSVGTSMGLVLVDAAFTNAADVLRAADAACYEAKRQGRNRVVVHTAESASEPGLS